MLSADRFLASAQRRRHRSVYFILAISTGLMAACAVALIAGGRRSSSVVERAFDAVPKYDVRLFDKGSDLQLAAVRDLPGVVAAESTDFIPFYNREADPEVAFISSAPADFAISNPTVRVLRGHRPDGSNPSEVVVNQAFVDNFSLDVGDRVPVVAFAEGQLDELKRGVYEPRGPEYDFIIAAVVRFPQEIALDEPRSPRQGFTSNESEMVISDLFWTAHRHEAISFGSSFDVRLERGEAGVAALVAAARAGTTNPDNVSTEPWAISDNKAAFAVPVDLETSALLAVGIGAALSAMLLLILLLRLERRLLDDQYSVLRAIGMTTAHLARTAVLRVIPAAAAAGLIAAIGAILLSPRFPIGLGHQLELHRGVQVNFVVVVAGTLCVVVALVAGAAIFARRAGLHAALNAPHRASRLLSSTPLPFHAILGARLVAGGRDRQRWSPPVALIFTAVVAVAAVVAVSTWLSSTTRLYDTPGARGWKWDLAIGNVNFGLDPATLEAVEHDPLVQTATAIGYGQATLNDFSTEVLGFDTGGSAAPAILRGRLPATASEAALGANVLRRLHLAIGDTVTLSLADSEFVAPPLTGGEVTLTIVGESISPVFGESDPADVGVVTLGAIAAAGGDAAPRLVLVNVVGPDVAANIASLIAPFTEEVHSDIIPARIVNLHRVRSLPTIGRGLAAALGLFSLVAAISASAHANRRKLAVLTALGLDRRDRHGVVGWQGLLTAGGVVLIGVPLGLLIGTAWWRRVAADLGVHENVSSRWWPLSCTVAGAVLVGVATALIVVRRLSVAATLRAA